MSNDYHLPASAVAVNAIHSTLVAFPIACFSLALFTDIAYWHTENLLWLHFSEWLLLAGLVFGVLTLPVLAIGYVLHREGPAWPALLGGVAVLLLAVLNSFIHTADGWTAVVPYGLAVSILTVLAMIVTGWLGRKGAHHV